MTPSDANPGPSASDLISQRIAELEDWRGATLGRIRRLILEADPGIVEAWKWATPVWSCGGLLGALIALSAGALPGAWPDAVAGAR